MGIIIKQSIRGSIWSYLGVIIGFVTTSYLYPNYLTTNTVGLLSLLISWTSLFSVLAALGLPGVTSRLFPYFRDNSNGHNGYLLLVFLVSFVGSLIFSGIFYFIRPWLVSSNLDKSALFTEYIYLLIPITIFSLLYLQLDTFIKVLYDAVFGIFVKDFIQRILILAAILLFIFDVFDLHQFILAFTVAVCVKGVLMIYYLIQRGEFNLKPRFDFLSPKLCREMWSVGTFSIIAGMGNTLVFNIDKIIINQIMGLSATGVYTIAFYFGVLVIIPSRPLLRISGTLIADAFRRDDLDYIEDIYKRSSLNQFIIGAFLFGGIVINIDNILMILGPDYTDGKWVILLIGMGYLVDMMTGANAQIISFSKHYRMALYFMVILLVLVVATLFVFVPLWGLTGAALAIAISIILNNIMRFAYLKYKFQMQPFTRNTAKVALIFIGASAISILLPRLSLIPDLLIRSAVFTLVFGGLILKTKISEDIDTTIRKLLKKVR